MDNLYQYFEGFSGGMMADLGKEQKNRHLSRLGATIVYTDYGQRVFVNTDASPYSFYYVNEFTFQNGECKKVDSLGIEPKELSRVEVCGHAYFHPDMYGLEIPKEGTWRYDHSCTRWGRYKEKSE